MKVAIIDYQLSNLYSVKHACDFVGINSIITSNPKEIQSADVCIIPGVGAFGDAMKNLTNLNLVSPIKKHISDGKPFIGICLGLQLLFEESDEFGNHKGLGILPGKIVRFSENNLGKEKLRVPQIGWNKIKIIKDNPLLSGVKENEFMYFVHSYYAQPKNKDIIMTTTTYGSCEYASGVSKDNVFAVQFHPEKSGKEGLKIYNNIAKLG